VVVPLLFVGFDLLLVPNLQDFNSHEMLKLVNHHRVSRLFWLLQL
jgi:hypothetical protein